MKISCITKFENLPTPAEWNRLAGDSPFRSWEWLSSWWDAFGSDLELMTVLVHHDSGELVAIAPWYVHQSKARGRVVRFLGDGKACSDYMGILVSPDDAEEVIAELSPWLEECGLGNNGADKKWNVLDLDGVSADDVTTPTLFHAISDHVIETVSEHTWTVSLPETWDDYLAGRKKRRRNFLRKIEKNFIKNGRAEIRYAETPEQAEAFLDSLIQLHTMRRQDLGCDGCFSHDRFTDFLETAMQRLQKAGKLWMTQVTIDGEVAANCFGIRQGDAIYLYQCGFNTKFTECRPGWIQNIFILQTAIDEGIKSVDFLRGDELYKSQLGGVPTQLLRLRVSAPTIVARVRNSVALFAGKVFHAMPMGSR